MPGTYSAGPLYARLRGVGRPLGELAMVAPALDGALAGALAVDRATRDRLVIFDPATAPLLRPLIAAEDMAPWHTGAADRWIVAVPAALAPTVGRHQALARHLDALAAPPGVQAQGPGGTPWWALADALAAPPPRPRIIVAGRPPAVAWDDTPALVGGPATVITAARGEADGEQPPYWLALLGSRVGLGLLAEGVAAAAIPIPEAPGPARAGLAGLALSAASLAGQIDTLRRAVLRRLVADFGPPGIYPGPLLSRWWTLDFTQLHRAVLSELRNDIPERFRATWAQIHADERATHDRAAARLAELGASIDAQAAALYGLGPGDMAGG